MDLQEVRAPLLWPEYVQDLRRMSSMLGVCNMPAPKRKRWCMRQKDRANRAQAQFDEEDEKETFRRTHLEVTIPNRNPPPDFTRKVQSDVRSAFAAPRKRKMSATEEPPTEYSQG